MKLKDMINNLTFCISFYNAFHFNTAFILMNNYRYQQKKNVYINSLVGFKRMFQHSTSHLNL